MAKSRHNPILPSWHTPRPVVLDEAYEREVERSTSKLERRYRQAEKRVQQAEARLARAAERPKPRATKRQLEQLRAEVELRRAELDEIARLMTHPTDRSRGGRLMHRTGVDARLELSGTRRRTGAAR